MFLRHSCNSMMKSSELEQSLSAMMLMHKLLNSRQQMHCDQSGSEIINHQNDCDKATFLFEKQIIAELNSTDVTL